MTKLDRAIEALTALPASRREEVAEMVLELTAQVQVREGGSVLSAEQQAEVLHRSETFVPGDPSRIDSLIARLT